MVRTVDDKMPFLEHLGELRTRIVRALIALLVGTLIGLPFSQYLVDWLARPITKLGYELVFTAPAEAFWVQMKVGLIAGIFISAPASCGRCGASSPPACTRTRRSTPHRS
jgi:sec-independent protein translocase protein TatC